MLNRRELLKVVPVGVAGGLLSFLLPKKLFSAENGQSTGKGYSSATKTYTINFDGEDILSTYTDLFQRQLISKDIYLKLTKILSEHTGEYTAHQTTFAISKKELLERQQFILAPNEKLIVKTPYGQRDMLQNHSVVCRFYCRNGLEIGVSSGTYSLNNFANNNIPNDIYKPSEEKINSDTRTHINDYIRSFLSIRNEQIVCSRKVYAHIYLREDLPCVGRLIAEKHYEPRWERV